MFVQGQEFCKRTGEGIAAGMHLSAVVTLFMSTSTAQITVGFMTETTERRIKIIYTHPIHDLGNYYGLSDMIISDSVERLTTLSKSKSARPLNVVLHAMDDADRFAPKPRHLYIVKKR